jgi:hypothetical protein
MREVLIAIGPWIKQKPFSIMIRAIDPFTASSPYGAVPFRAPCRRPTRCRSEGC